ncbi:MAG: PPOX class F420-dependent oxidoreductase [Chloroflexota bacterium]|nr:PPOX class F420-dependent oxidoreductase [Chloroflexota bacterium]
MAAKLTDAQQKLLKAKNFADIATLNKDGSAQVTPVWVEYDGDNVIINTEEKRQKTKNMKRDPRVTLSVIDMANPYQYVQIRGRVAEMTTAGADAVIDSLAKKYLGQDKYPYTQPGDVRVTVKIQPERVSGNVA